AVLNGTVLIMLVTCVLGPFLTERYGRRVALHAETTGSPDGARPVRVAVALANVETSEALMELALMLRPPDAHEPVYPLAIVRGGADTDAQVAVAERLMERAVLHAAAADVPVQPTTRIDLNPADGIALAAREVRASTVVLGWSGHTSPGALVFGTVLDQVLDATRTMVVVSRLVHPLATSRRVVVAVPPLAWREAGFGEAARALKALAAHKTAEVVAVVVAEDAVAVGRALERARPAAPVRLLTVDRWADATSTLDAEVRPTDLLVLLSTRRGALAWRPALDRLPRLLAGRFPQHDLLTLYLSEVEVGQLVAEALGRGDGDDGGPEGVAVGVADALELPAGHVTMGLTALDAVGALGRVIAPAFPGAPSTVARLAMALAADQGAYAPELRPGVVFFHDHTHEVKAPVLLVGVSAEGLTLPRTGGPTHVVLVLLAPAAMDRTHYLRRLALVAQLVRPEHVVAALRAAPTPEAARAALLGALQATPEAVER
ncbi:MAG TPA: universal stress protein, partial [Rhodothermales bacterium]|nr:universal stress protein [Rhodothermales bacterium]